MKAGKAHHHAGRPCTSTAAEHKDVHHKMGLRGGQCVSTMAEHNDPPTNGARWGMAPPARWGIADRGGRTFSAHGGDGAADRHGVDGHRGGVGIVTPASVTALAGAS